MSTEQEAKTTSRGENRTPVAPYELSRSPPPETRTLQSTFPPQAYPPQQQQQQQQQPQTYLQPDSFYARIPQQELIDIYTPGAQQVYLTAKPISTLTKAPAPVDCPVCGQREITSVSYESGNTTHAWACLLCFCFCLGCVPYLIESVKDAVHHCGRCNATLATWHRSGWLEVHQQQQTQPQPMYELQPQPPQSESQPGMK
ncbi:hypothetical protein VTN00DRAFT_413 [Thermoascus crustaceus]|uniref:uncharacterized protein n=1 Tax=Thermoascus crustaceus TaxID=5088 RepID=UPI0037436DD7